MYNNLPKMIKNTPELIKYSMIEQTRESVGAYGTDRMEFLKQQFRNIIDNVLPSEDKVSLILFDNMTLTKWLKIHRAQRKKYFKPVQTGNPIVDGVYQAKFSVDLVNHMEKYGKEYIKIISNIRKTIQQLFSLRDKLFGLLGEYSELDKMKDKSNPFTKTDHATITENVGKLEKLQELFTDEALWHISETPKDCKFKDYCPKTELCNNNSFS